MKIYKNFNIGNKFKNSAIAIGNFDGFHLGHQRVIKKAKQVAKRKKLKFGLMVFQPLPVMFFNKKLKNYRIDSLEQKINSSKKHGIDFLIVKKFDKKFSNIKAEDFIKNILYKKLKSQLLFISKNFNIGKRFQNSAIAIGKFDGFHLGHQRVIKKGKQIAKKNNLKFGLMIFQPLPVMFFNKKLKNYRIDSFQQKITSSKKQGIDFLIVKKFDKKFSNIKAEDFIEKILYKKLKTRLIFISKNFRFGKNRTGDIKLLKNKEKFFQYKINTITPLNKKGSVISSTLIRKNIAKGKIDYANKLLGRFWTIEGIVKRGEKRGRKIGFPTCNLDLKNYIVPKLGVYSAKIIVDNKIKKKGIVNIGYRPTFGKNKLLLEAHIFGLKKNLYDKRIKIMLIKFIRKEKRFKNIVQLKKQIKIDIRKAK